jgi:hypothetical protein
MMPIFKISQFLKDMTGKNNAGKGQQRWKDRARRKGRYERWYVADTGFGIIHKFDPRSNCKELNDR